MPKKRYDTDIIKQANVIFDKWDVKTGFPRCDSFIRLWRELGVRYTKKDIRTMVVAYKADNKHGADLVYSLVMRRSFKEDEDNEYKYRATS